MTDRVSDTLRQIKRSVDDLNKSTVNLTTQKKELQALGQELVNLGRAGQGIQQTTKHLRDFHQQFKEIGDRFHETGRVVKEQLAPAFEGLGFGVTTVGAAAGLLVKTLRDVAAESQKVQNISKLTGFDPASVAAMQTGVRAFGVSADQVISIVSNIGKQMDLIAGTPGGSGSDLLTKGRMALGDRFASDMRAIAKDPNISVAERNLQGVGRTLQELRRVQQEYSSQRAANVAEQIGLDPRTILLIQGGVDVLAHWRDMQRRIGEDIDPATLAQWGVAQDKLAASITGIKNAVAGTLIGDMTQLTTKLADFIQTNNEPIKNGIVQVVKDLGTAAKETVSELAPFVTQMVQILSWIDKFQKSQAAGQRSGDIKPFINLPSYLPGGTAGPIGRYLSEADVPMSGGALSQRLTTGLIGGALRSSRPRLYTEQDASTKWRGFQWPWSGGPSSNMNMPLQAQPFGESGVPAGVVDQAAMFRSGSLGTGSITTGWRQSSNIEDQRPNEEIVADEASRKGTEDNTAAQRDNTDQLRKLIDILARGHGNAIMDFTGGMGAGGMGGGYGAGQGPMYRPGVGPGTRARPGGVNNAPPHTVSVSPPPFVRHPAATHPGATVSTGPTQVTPTATPSSSIPSPNLMPQMQDGGVIRAPSTVVDNATGQPVATVAEAGPEYLVPPERIQRMEYQDPSLGPAPQRYNNPTSMGSNQRSRDLYYASGNYKLMDRQRNVISGFPSPILGLAAGMDLYRELYAGMTVNAANTKWAGSNRQSLPGYEAMGNTVVTREMLDDPKFAIPYFHAMTQAELRGPNAVSEAGFKEAYDMMQAGGYDEYYRQQTGQGAKPTMPPTGVAPGATPAGWPMYNQVYKPGGNAAQAVDSIMGLEGLRKQNPQDLAKIRQFLHDGGQSLDPATTSFCAATVNSALVQAGMQPLTDASKNVATQFLTKQGLAETGGQIISSPGDYHPELIQKGDVGVYTFGNPLGSPGGHVGMYAGPYNPNSGQVPFMSGNTSMAPLPGAGAVHLNQANPHSMYAVRLPQGTDSKSWDEKFPKAPWHPNDLQAITTRSPLSQIAPPGLVPRGGGDIDLSQPGLSSIPGVGDMLKGGTPKPEPAPPKPSGATSMATEKSPATGTGQQPKSIRLGHGKPAYGWAPGQGGQTNVPGAQLAGIPPALAQQMAIAKQGQKYLPGVGSALDYAGAVASGQRKFSLSGAAMAAAPLLGTVAGSVGGAALGLGGIGLGTAGEMLAGEFGGLGTALAGTVAQQGLQTVGAAALGSPEGTPLGQLATMAPTMFGGGRSVGGLGEAQPPGGLTGVGAVTHKVEGTGTINVNIKAPRGTNVNAASSGLFKKVNLNRGMSMEHADEHGQYAQ